MAGLGVRVFTDEMVTPRLAEELTRRGYDVVSTQASGRAGKGISDIDQLRHATAQGRAIYTFNIADFLALHRQWAASGRRHAGIIVSEDLNHDRAGMAQRLQRHLDTVAPRQQENRCLVLAR